MAQKVSMQDIADSIGVSKVTVSKVLRGQNDVSTSMRDKILEVAKELGYVYKGHRDQNNINISKIVILTSEQFLGSNDSFYIKLYKLLSENFDNLGIENKLIILDTAKEKELFIPDIIKSDGADGVIALGQFPREYLKLLQEYRIPLLFLDFYYDGFDVPSVNTDNFYGAYEMVSTLIKLGHKKIGFVGNINSTSSIQDRFLGYYKALLENSIPLNDDWILNDRTEEGKVIDVALPDDMPTAFFCNCDLVALSFINSLKQHGFSVPEDVSVASYDDSVHSLQSDPQITTVHVNIENMAHMAIKVIMKRIKNNGGSNDRILIKGKIIHRKSLAKPRQEKI